MYVAALRIADDFGCHAIGIHISKGSRICCPPAIWSKDAEQFGSPTGARATVHACSTPGPLPHFNEVDECAGLDDSDYRLHKALGNRSKTRLHDIRWETWIAPERSPIILGLLDQSGRRRRPTSSTLAGATGERRTAKCISAGAARSGRSQGRARSPQIWSGGCSLRTTA